MHLKLQGWRSGAITTLGRGGSDLTATTIGKALGLREIQVCNLFSLGCLPPWTNYCLVQATIGDQFNSLVSAELLSIGPMLTASA